jgi:hypothetical protein
LRIFGLRESGSAAKVWGGKTRDPKTQAITGIHDAFLPACFLREPRQCLPDLALLQLHTPPEFV